MMMKNKNIIRIAIVTAFILLIPLVAMQFTDEVDWRLFDFVALGALLFGSGLTYELISRKAGNSAYRAAIGVAVAAAFLLVWINGAVGIIGNEDNPVNLMYFWVVGVGIIGAFIARLRPQGMARALYATAIAQALVFMIAMIIVKPPFHSTKEIFEVLKLLTLNAFFALLFIGSGLLFRRAGNTARVEPKACVAR
jgi:hypothetical protein